jgi:adenosylcobinamide hydrolase
VRVRLTGAAAIAELPHTMRCLSSSVLGGGLGDVRTWLNVQVPSDYARTDPADHLRELSRGLRPPVAGMLTAADVRRLHRHDVGSASALATVGLGAPLAAAGTRPRALSSVGTINLFVVVDAPLTDGAAAGALQTATEAKAQALADARVIAANHVGLATGTATDVICIAFARGASEPFAGPVTRHGSDLARAVHGAVLAGARAHGRRREEARHGLRRPV